MGGDLLLTYLLTKRQFPILIVSASFTPPSPPPAPSSSTNTVKRAPKTDSDYG